MGAETPTRVRQSQQGSHANLTSPLDDSASSHHESMNMEAKDGRDVRYPMPPMKSSSSPIDQGFLIPIQADKHLPTGLLAITIQ